MKFRLRSLLLTTDGIAMLVAVFSIWLRSIDGISGNLLAILYPEDTEYAADYTDAGFRAVQPGMPRLKAYKLLGEPFDKWNNGSGEVVEWWTRSPSDTHYRQRVIIFHGDSVAKKDSEYWVD
jgi:hypothetical protein